MDEDDGVMLVAAEPSDEPDESDVGSTVYGMHTDTGTDTESVASSFASMKNRRKKEKKKAAAKARKSAASATGSSGGAGPSSSGSNGSGSGNGNGAAAPRVSVEYVSLRNEVLSSPAFAEFASVFGHFSTAEELMNGVGGGASADVEAEGGAGDKHSSNAGGASALSKGGADDEPKELSKRARKREKRLTIAELKQLVSKPEVVEAWDTTSEDPRLLVQLKAYRNSIPVPKHWCQKRKFLMGKRGMEKPPFQLPDFIAATGIERIRNAVLEREQAKKMKSKMKEKMQPKMGKIDIDYQVLHDAFFKYQTKPRLTKHGDLYYEGKEHEAHLRVKRPGHLSAELIGALEMTVGGPPPWLVNMQRYGPPPSYPNLKIPGLNAPIPTGASYGYHVGGWGKPPVDELGRPLYGDVFGSAEREEKERLEVGVSHEPWGAMEEADEDEDDDAVGDDGEGGGQDGSVAGTEDDIADGIASISSMAPSGMATPDAINLRKQTADGLGTPSAFSEGLDTPGATGAGPAPQLYQVLQQTESRIGSSAFGSTHGYIVPPPPPPGIGTGPAAANRTGGGGGAGRRVGKGSDGVELALDPSDLEKLDEGALRARYEQQRQAERKESAPEDMSDIIEEQERKRKRKLESQKNRGRD